MKKTVDGPCSTNFTPLVFEGNTSFADLANADVSDFLKGSIDHAPNGDCTSWGIPFIIDRPLVLQKGGPITVSLEPVRTEWFIFVHTTDIDPLHIDKHKLTMSSPKGAGLLGETVASYTLVYGDASEHSVQIRHRHQIGMMFRRWGENCFEAVAHKKQKPMNPHHENPADFWSWGVTQRRCDAGDAHPWTNWLWACENPHPEKVVEAIRFEPISGTVIVSAVSAGTASSNPLRWCRRKKAVLTMPEGEDYTRALDENGLSAHIQLDLGQVISVQPRPLFATSDWSDTGKSARPVMSEKDLLIEYTAHEDATFHLPDQSLIPVSTLEETDLTRVLQVIKPAEKAVIIRVVEKGSSRNTAVRLHIHGEAGEYLAPINRHRIPNYAWFEDYSVDIVLADGYFSTYIDGETTVKLPLGKVYVEVSKGFEAGPVRRVVTIDSGTDEIVLELDKVLPWREHGWVTADTHVHFLSPQSALLEGAGEGVNVVNLLASQWGELMTNVGDFDGKTIHGSKEAGGDGEYLVSVGTENRQHVMGHISLLGYEGNMIAPMTTGGPDESALGDPIEVLLTQWAMACREQKGVVVLPHFPNPRLENAASIVSGNVDGVEFCRGLDPYSLLDWYRYLNCGYMTAAVGGTDKMSATCSIGSARTYGKIADDEEFTFENWKKALREANTFVSCGPLMEFSVDGELPGSQIAMTETGGTVDIAWLVASVVMPMTRVELVVNGEIVESETVEPGRGEGHWSIRIENSSWIALLIRGCHPNNPNEEIIAAHSSPVKIEVENSTILSKADAMSILEQIEGAIAYFDTIGTKAELEAYKRMRLILTSTHRALHNRMHVAGYYHEHTPLDDHPEHHE